MLAGILLLNTACILISWHIQGGARLNLLSRVAASQLPDKSIVLALALPPPLPPHPTALAPWQRLPPEALEVHSRAHGQLTAWCLQLLWPVRMRPIASVQMYGLSLLACAAPCRDNGCALGRPTAASSLGGLLGCPMVACC
jgi:hypothetical protein